MIELREVMEAFTEMKATVEAVEAMDSVLVERLDKINVTLDAHEVKNQLLVKARERQP